MTRVAAPWAPVVGLALLFTACATPTPSSPPPSPPGTGGATQPADEVPLVTELPGWRTDFSRMAEGVSQSEFIRALAGRDVIPSLVEPALVAVRQVDFLTDAEPVIAVEVEGEWRAYPIQILIWHEIANDRLGGQEIAVTFCPLCYTSVVFSRRLADVVYDFGVSGYLRRSDLVMYDRQTETWWQQATGRALMGALVGRTLSILPSQLVAWASFREAHPDATVLSRETGFEREYGVNPYPGWDDTERNPFLPAGQLDPCEGASGCVDPKERVGVLMAGAQSVVYRFSLVAAAGGLVHDVVGETPVLVRWLPNVTSALDNQLLERSDQVGALVAFDRRVGSRELTFALRGDALIDDQTESTWDELGAAIRGPLVGAQLRAMVMDTPYWFAAAAFGSDLRIWSP